LGKRSTEKRNSRKRVFWGLCFRGNGPRVNEIREIGPQGNVPNPFALEFKFVAVVVTFNFSTRTLQIKLEIIFFVVLLKIELKALTGVHNSKLFCILSETIKAQFSFFFFSLCQ
jgi:hypothetical protein